MAMVNFPYEKYPSVELNQVDFLFTGKVLSQTPLGAEFTAAKPCLNGSWVCAERHKATIDSIAALTDVMGIVFTSEKEYASHEIGLKNFGRKVAGDMPRVGVLSKGDLITTNCLQYDDTEYTDVEDLITALQAAQITPVYVAPVVGSPIPKLTATKPASGTYGVVVKLYTVPNGERGVQYEIVTA